MLKELISYIDRELVIYGVVLIKKALEIFDVDVVLLKSLIRRRRQLIGLSRSALLEQAHTHQRTMRIINYEQLDKKKKRVIIKIKKR